jgi:aerotaxis receptor
MKKNFPVTGIEKPFPKKLRLVSKTDLKGITTYANDAFVAMSGFSREELIGKNHNIVRHPDMPPQAFKWLWDTMKANRPWRGIVKNRCKNGDHYWVEALVVPVIENDKLVGYMSVRNPPSREQVAEAEALYRQLNESGAAIGSRFDRFRFNNLPLHTKLRLAIQGTLFVVLVMAQIWISNDFKKDTYASAKQQAEQVANETIDSANMLMETGAISDVANRKLLIKKIMSSGNIKSLQLVRAQQVVNQFGPGLPEEHIKDDTQRKAMETKTPYYSLTSDETGSPVFRAVTPYVVSHDFHGTDCLNCHQVEVGSVNGASDIEIDMKPAFARLHEIQLGLTIGQIALQIFLYFVIGATVKNFIRRPLTQAMEQFGKIIQGDLSSKIDISKLDEMGELLCELQTMQAHIQVMLDEMGLAASTIQERCGNLDEKIIQVADQSLEQQDHVQQIASTMEELSQSISEVASAANDSAIAALESQKIIESNNQRMQMSMDATTRVVQAVQSSGKTITDLEEEIQKIGAITKVIKEIADQTNLLALNAAIEAARAGEQGRGFAVVADEVRKLAERTGTSTGNISAMVTSIHAVTQTAVSSMDQAVAEVERSIAMTRENVEGLNQIMKASKQVTDGAQHIADAAKEQSLASEDVARNLSHITDLVEHNSKAAEMAKDASSQLTRTASELKTMVEHFEVESR